MTRLPFTKALLNRPGVEIYTESGHRVNVLSINLAAKMFPIQGVIKYASEHYEIIATWSGKGKYMPCGDSGLDLYMLIETDKNNLHSNENL